MRLKPARESEITALLANAAAAGVFPGAAAAWGYLDQPPLKAWAGYKGLTRQRTLVDENTVYDLASLTKVLAVTALSMYLAASGRLEPARPLTPGDLGRPEALNWLAGRPGLTAGHLLGHQGGLPAWRPFHQQLALIPRPGRPGAALKAIFEEAPLAAPGRRTLYSDLGFMILGFMIERISGRPLDELFTGLLAEPLGLADQIGFHPLKWAQAERLAPSEDGPRWPGPLNYPGLKRLGRVPLGQVHDDNARWLGGAAGQAGLFGSLGAVWRLLVVLIKGRAGLFDEKTSLYFRQPRRPAEEGPARAWGFDLKGRAGGALAGSRWSGRSAGHLGYTGVSLWHDPEKDFGAVLLSNRVHPRAGNLAINGFRPIFHQAVLQEA